MRRASLILCALQLLMVYVYAAEDQGNFTHEDEQDDTVQYEPYVNFTNTWNRDENSTRDDKGSIQHEFYTNYTKEFHEEGSQDVPGEAALRDNSTKSYGDNLTTLHEQSRPGDKSSEKNFKKCNAGTACIRMCCELGHRMIDHICVSDGGDYILPEVNETGKTVDEVLPLNVSGPCAFSHDPIDDYVILNNGSIYQPLMKKFVDPTTYCFAVMNSSNYMLNICVPSRRFLESKSYGIPYAPIVSLPFLLLTFVVYTVLPKLWNIHGYILRAYIGSLFIAYASLLPLRMIPPKDSPDIVCVGSAFLFNFSISASFFWSNVMCFDIWWMFSKFRSLQGSVKQREKKKFIIYSIYAWGCASILTIICVIMNFVSVPKHFIRPEIGEVRCWFITDKAKWLYFYGPLCVPLICNICLFISTALKIVRHEKDTAHHLRGSESRCYDDNRQWFKLYLKLFIVMGINWSIEMMSWLFNDNPPILWKLLHLINGLQGPIIFIIFVCKNKIKKLLLRRFGCQKNLFPGISTRSNYSTTSSTCTTPTGVIPFQITISPYKQTNYRAKNLSDETNCS